MNAEQFLWWLGGVLATVPATDTLNAKGMALDTIRAQLASVLVGQQLTVGLKHDPKTSFIYPPGVRGTGNHRAEVAAFYEQQQDAAQRAAMDSNARRNLEVFGAIPAPEDERSTDALMIERGYQPKGQ